MAGFQEIFSFRAEGEDGVEEEYERPPWLGPPDDELGVCVPQAIVLGRSDRAVVALRCVTAYSTGLAFDLVAVARGLRQAEANRLFHDQHVLDDEEGPSEGFLRIGVELADGSRISNLGNPRRHVWRPGTEPEGPLLVPSGGGSGSAGSGRVTMNPGLWLWPLPPRGPVRLFVEWPALDIALESTAFESAPILAASTVSQPLWESPAAPWRS